MYTKRGYLPRLHQAPDEEKAMTAENEQPARVPQQDGQAFFRNRAKEMTPPRTTASPAALILGTPLEGRELHRKIAEFHDALHGTTVPIIEIDRKADHTYLT
jgi:hypothetical protein